MRTQKTIGQLTKGVLEELKNWDMHKATPQSTRSLPKTYGVHE